MDLTDEQWAVIEPNTCHCATHPIRPAIGASNRVDSGVLEHILQAIADDLLARGQLDLSECFIDGTFVIAGYPLGEGAQKLENQARVPSG